MDFVSSQWTARMAKQRTAYDRTALEVDSRSLAKCRTTPRSLISKQLCSADPQQKGDNNAFNIKAVQTCTCACQYPPKRCLLWCVEICCVLNIHFSMCCCKDWHALHTIAFSGDWRRRTTVRRSLAESSSAWNRCMNARCKSTFERGHTKTAKEFARFCGDF